MKIIAEIGSNVKTLEHCLNSITLAKQAGADIVKFQYFTDQCMYGRDLGNKPSLEEEWLEKLKIKADATGIELMITFFSPEKLEKFGHLTSKVKIASSDMCYLDLLTAAMMTGKEIILSTGGHSLAEVKSVLHFLNGKDVTLMYCESAYPARCTNLEKLSLLKSLHDKVGLSDHSLEMFEIPKKAKMLGCLYLEKHVNMMDVDSPDSGHSLSRDQFFEMCNFLKGKYNLGLRSSDEKPMSLKYNRRLIATKDIKIGESFKYNSNFGCYRSLADDINGYAPFAEFKVRDKNATRDIKAGEPIGPKEVGV